MKRYLIILTLFLFCGTEIKNGITDQDNLEFSTRDYEAFCLRHFNPQSRQAYRFVKLERNQIICEPIEVDGKVIYKPLAKLSKHNEELTEDSEDISEISK